MLKQTPLSFKVSSRVWTVTISLPPRLCIDYKPTTTPWVVLKAETVLMTYGSLIFRVVRQIVAQGEYKSRLGSSLTSKSFAGGD
jgi:hypothetical protein